MGSYYKHEIQVKREENLEKDNPTPAKTSCKKIDKPFIIQKRYVGPDCKRLFTWKMYNREWHNVSSFKKEVSAKQALKAEITKAWYPSTGWEYRIINLHETNE